MTVRAQILDTAEALFNERGYTAVGIDLIRDTAQVSKTTMYRQFENKQGLIYAVLERRDQRFREALTTAAASAGTTEGKVMAIIAWHYQWFEKEDFKGCMFMHALAEFKKSDIAVARLAQAHKAWLKRLLQEQLSGPTAVQERDAIFIMTILEGLIVQAEFGSDLPSHDHIKGILEPILAAPTP